MHAPIPSLVSDATRPDVEPKRAPSGAANTPEALRLDELALLRRKVDGLVTLMGGAANVFLQLSWPEVGRGVVESTVESGQATRHPLKRFRTTITYLGIAQFGSDDQVAAYREAVNTSHRHVRSGPDSPVKYNAFNRDLQLWVASCLFYGFWDAATRMHGPMTPEEEEIMLRAGARFGTGLQMPASMWHTSMADFWTYWEAGLERAHIDEVVAAYFDDLLNLRLTGPIISRILGPLHVWLNTGFTPEPIRAQLGLEWTDADQRRHDRVMRLLGALSRPLPHQLRAFPVNTMVHITWLKHRLGRPMV